MQGTRRNEVFSLLYRSKTYRKVWLCMVFNTSKPTRDMQDMCKDF